MIEEIEHERFVDLFNVEFLDTFLQRVRSVAEEQLDGIAVSEDGVGRKALLDWQIVAKETKPPLSFWLEITPDGGGWKMLSPKP